MKDLKSDTREFRLVFERNITGARIQKIASYLRSQLSVPEERVRVILTSPPRIISTFSTDFDAENVRRSLEELGCLTHVEQTMRFGGIPVEISMENEVLIRKETSKVLRCNSSLSLLLVSIYSLKPSTVLPSFLGNFQMDLSANFRDSDSLMGMNEENFLFLCFGTDRPGATVVRTKIHRLLDKFLEGAADIHIGLSIFPEEARTARELLRLAADDQVRHLSDTNGVPDTTDFSRNDSTDNSREQIVSPDADATDLKSESVDLLTDAETAGADESIIALIAPDIMMIDETPPEIDLSASAPSGGRNLPDMSEYFDEIRGDIFFRLLQMDHQSLQAGLMTLPLEQRHRFRDRLPWNSALLDLLRQSELTENPPSDPDENPDAAREFAEQAALDDASIRHLDAVVRRMALEENLQAREQRNKKVMEALGRNEDLPTLPAVAMRVFHLASEVDVEASELAKVVSGDPALTSKLLKMVNSAFYGSQKQIHDVQHALAILGTSELMDIAFGLAMAKVFDLKGGSEILKPEVLWQHSIRTGVIAQALVEKLQIPHIDGAFTAGLLHDVGIIFGLQNFTQDYREIREHPKRNRLPLFNLEEERFGMNHATMGMHLARSWNLPPALVEAVAWHHQPQEAKEAPRFAAIIGLADYLDVQLTEERKHGSAALKESMPWLSYGHWRILQAMIPDLNESFLQDLKDTAQHSLEENSAFIDGVGKM